MKNRGTKISNFKIGYQKYKKNKSRGTKILTFKIRGQKIGKKIEDQNYN